MAFVVRWLSKPVTLVSAILSTACSQSPVIGPSAQVATVPGTADFPAQLIECPSSPNCVSSTTADTKKQTPAFSVGGLDVSDYQIKLVSSIEKDGGVVQSAQQGYVWATYTSTVFRFVDDIEWLFNQSKNEFDVRSASRVGHSDFGANRKRVDRIRTLLTH